MSNKLGQKKTKDQEHEARVDAEWRRLIGMGQDIERLEIAELLASDTDSMSDEECGYDDEIKLEGNDSSSDYGKPLSKMAKKYSDKNQSKICFARKKESGEEAEEGKIVSTSGVNDDKCDSVTEKKPILCARKLNAVIKKRPKAPWISKRKSVPVKVKKEKKQRKRKVKKRLGLDPFQQAEFAQHYRHDFYGF